MSYLMHAESILLYGYAMRWPVLGDNWESTLRTILSSHYPAEVDWL